MVVLTKVWVLLMTAFVPPLSVIFKTGLVLLGCNVILNVCTLLGVAHITLGIGLDESVSFGDR